MTEQFRGERTLMRVFIGASDPYVRHGRVRRERKAPYRVRRGVDDAD